MNQKDEEILRENIRQMIRFVKKKRLIKENKTRNLLKKLMRLELKKMVMESSTPDVDPTPNKSTGINVLEELLKKIIPILETDFKSLTTSIEQRKSFRAHILNAVVNTLTPARINTQAGEEKSDTDIDLQEEVDIDIVDDDDKFIDIRTDAEKKAEDETEESDPREEFGAGIEADKTGRNVAYQCFKKIEGNVIDAYELLSDTEDQELFYDYLIANLKLYFDKFEGELDDTVEEPTNQAYDMAKQEEPTPAGAGEELSLEL